MKRLLLTLGLVFTAPVALAQDIGKPLDDKVVTYVLPPDQAVVVVRFFATQMSGDNRMLWSRIRDDADPTAAPDNVVDLLAEGFNATYRYSLFGGSKDATVTRVIPVKPGRYVMSGRTANANWRDSFCFGAPYFSIAAGEVRYIGDYEVFMLRKMWDGQYRNGLRYEADLPAARTALAARFPDLADKMTAWQPANGAQFDCAGDEFVRYDLPQSAVAGPP